VPGRVIAGLPAVGYHLLLGEIIHLGGTLGRSLRSRASAHFVLTPPGGGTTCERVSKPTNGWSSGAPSAGKLLLATGLFVASAEASTDPKVHLEARSFLFARYATTSASSLYAAYGFGKVGFVLGVVGNPRTGYNELIGGAVSRIAWGPQSVTMALALAEAPDSAYLQTYLVPSLSIASLSLSASIEWYEPLQDSGVRQLDLNPLTVLVHLGPRVYLGGVYALGLAGGGAPHHRAGPALQYAFAHGSLRVELVRSLRRSSTEVRVVINAGF